MLQVYVTPVSEHDGYEVRLLIGGEWRPDARGLGVLTSVGGDEARASSIALGTIHAGDLRRMADWFVGEGDRASGRQMHYVTEKVETMLSAHGLRTVADRPESWRQLDALAASWLEPGPPWLQTVAVTTTGGMPEPSLRF